MQRRWGFGNPFETGVWSYQAGFHQGEAVESEAQQKSYFVEYPRVLSDRLEERFQAALRSRLPASMPQDEARNLAFCMIVNGNVFSEPGYEVRALLSSFEARCGRPRQEPPSPEASTAAVAQGETQKTTTLAKGEKQRLRRAARRQAKEEGSSPAPGQQQKEDGKRDINAPMRVEFPGSG